METMTTILIITLLISISINAIMIWYSSKLTKTTYAAVIAASEILGRLDAYKTHLQSIFELQLFYGDRNLKEVIDHTKDMIKFMNRFDNIYSFTQSEIEDVISEEEEDDNITTATGSEAS